MLKFYGLEKMIAQDFLGWKKTEQDYIFIKSDGTPLDIRDTFTKKIEYAWMIADAMKENWSDFAITNEGGKWNVYWGYEGFSFNEVSSETVELALSVACLKSLELELMPEQFHSEEYKLLS